MKHRKGLVLSAVALASLSLLIIGMMAKSRSTEPEHIEQKITERPLRHEENAKKTLTTDADDLKNDLQSPSEILNRSRALKALPKSVAIEELKRLVMHEEKRYEAIFDEYENAIKEYESLSSDFDSMLRDDKNRQVISKIDKKLQSQAHEILRLESETNLAYSNLMAKYDEVIPVILAKHF